MQIARHPTVLAAINPIHGASFFLHNGWHGYLVLGAVFLVVMVVKALYADMGHFGNVNPAGLVREFYPRCC